MIDHHTNPISEANLSSGYLNIASKWIIYISLAVLMFVWFGTVNANSVQLTTGTEEITVVDGTIYSSTLQVTNPASISDGEIFLISSGGNSVVFEFDSDGDGVSPGNTPVNILAAGSVQDVRNSVLTSFSSVSALLDANASLSGVDSLQITTDNAAGLAVNSLVISSSFSFSAVNTTEITSTSIVATDAGISQFTMPAPASVFSSAPFSANIIATSPSNLVDGDVISIIKGNESITLEIDKSGDGVTSGNLAVDVSGATSVRDVRDSIASAIAGSSALTDITTSAVGENTITLDSPAVPLQLLENVSDIGFQVSSSPFSLSPVSLSFDYLFETVTGDLQIILDGDVLSILSAPGVLQSSANSFDFQISDANSLNQIGLSGVELSLSLSGIEGSSILIDNILFAGLLNGDISEESLNPWSTLTSGSSSVNLVVTELSPIPIPSAFLLMMSGLVFLFGFVRRASNSAL